MAEDNRERRSTVSTPRASIPVAASPDESGRAIDDLIKMNPNKLQNMTLRQAADEFLKSEQIYVERGLRVAVETFQLRIVHTRTLGEDIITEQESQQIFFSIKEIYALSRKMCSDLVDLRLEGFEKFCEDLGKTISVYIPFLKMYSQYIHNFKKANETLTNLQTINFRFERFLKLNEMCSGSKLLSLLRTPIARLPQYLAYLGTIQSKMEFENPALKQAISELKSVADTITKRCKDDAARQWVVEIQTKVFSDTVDIVAPHRKLVKSGVIDVILPESQVFMFKSKRKEYEIWLFNDVLLLGHNPSMLVRGYISKIARLEGMIIEDLTGKKGEGDIHIRCDIDSIDLVLACKVKSEAAKWIKVLTKFAEKAATLTLGDSILNAEDFKNAILKKPLKGGRIRRPSTLRRATITSSEPSHTSESTMSFHPISLPQTSRAAPPLPSTSTPVTVLTIRSNQAPPQEEKWEVGMQCLAPWSDNNFYLATIESINGQGPDAVVYIMFTEYQEKSVAVLSQIRRVPKAETFAVGEECMAPWSDNQYYPAVVDSLEADMPFANITFTQYKETACVMLSKLRKVISTSADSDAQVTSSTLEAPSISRISQTSSSSSLPPPARLSFSSISEPLPPSLPEDISGAPEAPEAPPPIFQSLAGPSPPTSRAAPNVPEKRPALGRAPSQVVPSGDGDRDSLLSNIRQGQTLRHVASTTKAPEPRAADNGQLGLLMKSLERYRKAVELDQPDADDDSDFD